MTPSLIDNKVVKGDTKKCTFSTAERATSDLATPTSCENCPTYGKLLSECTLYVCSVLRKDIFYTQVSNLVWANFLPESGSSSRQMKTFPFMLPPLVKFTKPPWIWPPVWSSFLRQIVILEAIWMILEVNYHFDTNFQSELWIWRNMLFTPQWRHFQLLGVQVQSLSMSFRSNRLFSVAPKTHKLIAAWLMWPWWTMPTVWWCCNS